MLFGTDTPMDMGTRGMFTKTTIASLEALKISESDKEGLFYGYVSGIPVEREKRLPPPPLLV